MNKIKYNKKRSNKNVKSIPPYNKKGFFKTNNEFLLNKRYELFTNKKVRENSKNHFLFLKKRNAANPSGTGIQLR